MCHSRSCSGGEWTGWPNKTKNIHKQLNPAPIRCVIPGLVQAENGWPNKTKNRHKQLNPAPIRCVLPGLVQAEAGLDDLTKPKTDINNLTLPLSDVSFQVLFRQRPDWMTYPTRRWAIWTDLGALLYGRATGTLGKGPTSRTSIRVIKGIHNGRQTFDMFWTRGSSVY